MKGKESKSRRTRTRASEEEPKSTESKESTQKSSPKKKETKMSLTSWIGLMISAKKLRPEQKKEIQIFMKKQNLSETEEREKFDKAFSRF